MVLPYWPGAGEGSEAQEGSGGSDPSNARNEHLRASPGRCGGGWESRESPQWIRPGAKAARGGGEGRGFARQPGLGAPRPGPAPPPDPGRTHSMILETCSRTGTLRSLKAVVMKQPKVSAAITLSEKANSEFARDSTVFIAADAPKPAPHAHPAPRSGRGPPLCEPRRLRRAFRGGGSEGALPRPRLLSGPRTRASARAPAAWTHPPAGRTRRTGEPEPRGGPPLLSRPGAATNQRPAREGRGFAAEGPPPGRWLPVVRPAARLPSFPCPYGRCSGAAAFWVLRFRRFAL